MLRTKFMFENKQRARTLAKFRKQEFRKQNQIFSRNSEEDHGRNSSVALHSPLMRSIHPKNFTTIASIVLEICSGQNSSMKINKGQ